MRSYITQNHPSLFFGVIFHHPWSLGAFWSMISWLHWLHNDCKRSSGPELHLSTPPGRPVYAISSPWQHDGPTVWNLSDFTGPKHPEIVHKTFPVHSSCPLGLEISQVLRTHFLCATSKCSLKLRSKVSLLGRFLDVFMICIIATLQDETWPNKKWWVLSHQVGLWGA